MPRSDPDASLTETVDRLRSLAAAAPDASGHPAMYAYVTRAVQQRLRSGDFAHPAGWPA